MTRDQFINHADEERINTLATIISGAAIKHMAALAGVTGDEIKAVIKTDPEGATAREFYRLLLLGVNNIPELLGEVWDQVNA